MFFFFVLYSSSLKIILISFFPFKITWNYPLVFLFKAFLLFYFLKILLFFILFILAIFNETEKKNNNFSFKLKGIYLKLRIIMFHLIFFLFIFSLFFRFLNSFSLKVHLFSHTYTHAHTAKICFFIFFMENVNDWSKIFFENGKLFLLVPFACDFFPLFRCCFFLSLFILSTDFLS